MAKKKKDSPDEDLFSKQEMATPPDFAALLAKPLLDLPLPRDFSANDESQHLVELWSSISKLQAYRFDRFVHAGGSGLVFKVFKGPSVTPLAMKIARKKLFVLSDARKDAAKTLSPVSESELRALEQLSHPNVVRLYDAFENEHGVVVAICTTFVDSAASIDHYLATTLEKNPDPKGIKGLLPFSPQRLDVACVFLIERCSEIASALQHMHGLNIFHFDIKPANILSTSRQAVLTDMGSCIHASRISEKDQVRVHFTWTYAHPKLTDMLSDPASITAQGLRASATVDPSKGLAKYDLFAFGKTIQECLAILEQEFGERCHASYGFRFLHIIACLLLDGYNAPGKGIIETHGRRFVNDVALGYPPDLFSAHKIQSANELVERLARFSRQYSWNASTPELDPWQPEIINSGHSRPVPFTKRVAALFNHPCLRRLKREPELGWMREVYPGATHTRWSHTLGVFSALVSIYNALLSDPEVPTFRILADARDLSHAFVAAVLHDLGQSAFGHDFEKVSSVFKHEQFVVRLLDDETWGRITLRKAINRNWPEVDIRRVLQILEGVRSGTENVRRAIDGVASDCIDGPIDADKLDYLTKDSVACGVPYGQNMNPERLLRALTVTAISVPSPRLGLAYKAKGRSAVESLLLARYQMYGAVYWHHTIRCLQSSFVSAAVVTFEKVKKEPVRGLKLTDTDIQELFYERIVCGKPWSEARTVILKRRSVSETFFQLSPPLVAADAAIDFVYQFADDVTRNFLERLASRDIYKRVFEMRLGELADAVEYADIKSQLSPSSRPAKAAKLQLALINKIDSMMRQRGTRDTIAENAARDRVRDLRNSSVPLVVIDFPVRGIPEERNVPKEIGDPYRKYFAMPAQGSPDKSVFHVVRKLQMQMAAIRVFAAPELHELIIRYLTSDDIHDCVGEVIHQIRSE